MTTFLVFVGAVVLGDLINLIVRAILRRVQERRFERMRVCKACKGLRVIDGHIVHNDETIAIAVPCPVCNSSGKFPRAARS